MSKALYYEDFTPGQELRSRRSYLMDKDGAVAFAKEYDPQLQHIDEAWAQKEGGYGELIVSGWQTAAVTMKLKTETDLFNVAGGLIGMGLENVKWPRPTMPGDSLRIVVTILEKRVSASKPGKGIVRYKVDTFNQRDELAMTMTTAVIVPLRVPA